MCRDGVSLIGRNRREVWVFFKRSLTTNCPSWLRLVVLWKCSSQACSSLVKWRLCGSSYISQYFFKKLHWAEACCERLNRHWRRTSNDNPTEQRITVGDVVFLDSGIQHDCFLQLCSKNEVNSWWCIACRVGKSEVWEMLPRRCWDCGWRQGISELWHYKGSHWDGCLVLWRENEISCSLMM